MRIIFVAWVQNKLNCWQGQKFDKNIPVDVIPEIYSLEDTNVNINSELDNNIVSDLFNKRVKLLNKVY